MPPKKELLMSIQPKIIDHLGINMYTNLHAVLAELIANSWDADAEHVDLTVPIGTITKGFKIIVKDVGKGMYFDELNDLYLQVGRNRRGNKDIVRSPNGRRILGRKGIGKFAVFGVAKKVQVISVKKGKATEFSMSIDKIKAVKKGEPYKPEIIRKDEQTDEESGVTVTLLDLKRRNPIDIKLLRQGLANRFTIIGESIQVYLNSEKITQDDAKIEDIEYEWKINESISKEHPDWKVKGTVWAKKGTIREQHNRGVALYAGKKLVQEPTYFGATSGKEYAYNHIFGKLDADFLDEKNDVIGTNRSSINWESEEGQTIKEWGKKRLTDISIDWSDKRVTQKTYKLKQKPDIKEWFEGLSKPEQDRATKAFNAITKNDELSEERTFELAGYVRDIFKFNAFQELSEKITEATPDDVPKIIQLFRDWEHLEASEMYRILKGRIATINKLETFIKKDAKEVPTIHEYMKKFPWILDPRWTVIYDEVRFSKLLKEKFPDKDKPPKDRRIDFLCFTTWPAIIVVELKRPGSPVGKDELEQLREYVLFIEEHKGGTDPQFSHNKVFGYLICENEQRSHAYDIRREKLAEQGMYVRKYTELLAVAKNTNDDFISKYEELKKLGKKS